MKGLTNFATLISSVSCSVLGTSRSRRFFGREYATVNLSMVRCSLVFGLRRNLKLALDSEDSQVDS